MVVLLLAAELFPRAGLSCLKPKPDAVCHCHQVSKGKGFIIKVTAYLAELLSKL